MALTKCHCDYCRFFRRSVEVHRPRGFVEEGFEGSIDACEDAGGGDAMTLELCVVDNVANEELLDWDVENRTADDEELKVFTEDTLVDAEEVGGSTVSDDDSGVLIEVVTGGGTLVDDGGGGIEVDAGGGGTFVDVGAGGCELGVGGADVAGGAEAGGGAAVAAACCSSSHVPSIEHRILLAI
ncbi:MAG: hypothetical protein Q9227_005554 [Pyrenula ochraceoflavens]